MIQRRWKPEIDRDFQIDTVSAHYNQDGKFGNQGRNWGKRSVSDLRGFLANHYKLEIDLRSQSSLNRIPRKPKSQLIGSSGDIKNGEGARKRLKISVPHFNNSDLIKGYSKTLIGRCMNPAEQNVKFLVGTLPKIWGLEEKVVGTDLGLGRFQFDFDAEEDIETVLKMQPFHFDYWMISLVRWQPRKSKNYPSEITFWIKVLGVPLEFWEAPTFRSIGDAIGVTKEVDLDYGRVQVVVDGYKELTFETTVDFKGGEYYEEEEAPVSLRYEKLFGFCETCFSLCHKMEKCPLTIATTEKAVEIRDDAECGLNDRARSYKGVVINGNGGQQDRGREKREYQGKGKGKMFEETDSKWVRAADRESKASNHKNHRNGHRGDEGNSRYRNSRREHTRTHHQDDRSRNIAGTRGERVPRIGFQPEGLEEGEIKEKEMERSIQMEEKVPERTQPSQAFLDALMATQGELSKVLPNPSSGEQELGVELGVENMDLGIVDGNNVETDGNLGLAENYIEDASFGNHKSMGEDEVQMLIEEEIEEEVKAQVVITEVLEEKKKFEDMDGKDGVAGEVEKRQGVRKKVVKPSVGAAASNKLKMAQLVTAKRVVAKPGIRHGDHSKQGEDKGTSGPKHDSAKQVKDP
ncbi:uncharacterized protein LOC106428731 [Brassica napus]|uniref:uncharacterized protein LOC106428731 n=1 Tax=Brassica napus TaxID=3708 RepID=UPI0006AAA2F6|nr:uncharacterized protein LOC106428731 [Brassica napus]